LQQLEDAAALDFFLGKNKVCWTELTNLPSIRCSEINPLLKGKVEKVNKQKILLVAKRQFMPFMRKTALTIKVEDVLCDHFGPYQR